MSFMTEIVAAFRDLIISVLPLSPFRDFIDSLAGIPYLGWLNWFFPVGGVLKVMSAWLTAIGLFYLYSIILRWVKVISG